MIQVFAGDVITIVMMTSTPYASLFASYRSNFHDDLLHPASTEFTPHHSATLLSAHLGLLSSIFGRQADVLSPERDRRAVAVPATRDGGGDKPAAAADVRSCEDLRVELDSRELWGKFDAHCTEMVITKSGRYVPLTRALGKPRPPPRRFPSGSG